MIRTRAQCYWFNRDVGAQLTIEFETEGKIENAKSRSKERLLRVRMTLFEPIHGKVLH